MIRTPRDEHRPRQIQPILWLWVVLLVHSAALGNPPETMGPLIPDHKWGEHTKLWLARALVSEAGWEETTDHVAIAYVLFRRWQIARRSYPRASMISVIKSYCAGFGNRVPTPRQRWVLNLSLAGTRPEGWPNDIRWQDYRDRWLKVLEHVEAWRMGRHPDPCNGESRYWGGPMDRPSPRMLPMDCGPTKNVFYTVRRKSRGSSRGSDQDARPRPAESSGQSGASQLCPHHAPNTCQ